MRQILYSKLWKWKTHILCLSYAVVLCRRNQCRGRYIPMWMQMQRSTLSLFRYTKHDTRRRSDSTELVLRHVSSLRPPPPLCRSCSFFFSSHHKQHHYRHSYQTGCEDVLLVWERLWFSQGWRVLAESSRRIRYCGEREEEEEVGKHESCLITFHIVMFLWL